VLSPKEESTMDEKARELRDELNRIIVKHADHFPKLPTFFPPELVERVVQYVQEQRAKGISMAECSQKLDLPQARLHYWLYGRNKKVRAPLPRRPPTLRPVQVSTEMVPVYDGVRERRYTVRSPAGWEVKDLTLPELMEILRGLV
jgi:hypothetical protein